jgi:hypothetical protein
MCRLSGNCRDLGVYGGGSEQAIAMQVKIDTLEKVLEVENAIATSFENLDLVVEAFHKAAALALNEVVGDFFPPSREQFQEIVKTIQATLPNVLEPA